LRIGIPRETKPGETLVAATARTAAELAKLGYDVVVESGAFATKNPQAVQNLVSLVVAVSGAFATKNPQAMQNLVSGLVKAAALIKADPTKAASHVGAALGKGIVDPELIQKALVSPASRFEIDPRKIIEPARAMQAYQVKLGSLDKEAPFDGLFETQYYERAVKAGG
jgi:ABC-type nitrate/sulfonate/bicarbonate transport system substrate-binding protein